MALKLHEKKYYTDKSLDIIRHKYTDAYNEPLHAHDFIELMYVYEGKTIHSVGGEEYALAKGDLLFINYGNTHSFDSVGNMEYINIILKPDFISQSLCGEKNVFSLLTLSDFNDFSSKIDRSKKYMHFTGDERSKIEALISIMEDESVSAEGNSFILRSALNVFLAIIFRKMSLYLTNKLSFDSELLNYIKQNCSEKLTLNGIAAMCSYNPSYFSRSFKNLSGMSFSDFLSKCRIDKAAFLLQSSSKNIEDIISECGFADRTRFFRLFSARMGVSPLKYRKNNG